ncbi:MAG: hypothetical protein DRG78_07205 [Epsilonproteobacteria bacterium]|nr:MAG: hypothetical protein DRG78_07205 [Campylobacterota bacterium]
MDNKIEVKFFSLDEIYNTIVTRDEHLNNFPFIGVENNGTQLILADILYEDFKIRPKPYTLFAKQEDMDVSYIKIVEYFIEYLIRKKQISNGSTSVFDHIRKIKHFTRWLHGNKYNVPETIEEAQNKLGLYFYYLKSNIKTGKYSSSYASSHSTAATKMLGSMFNTESVFVDEGLSHIQKSIPKPQPVSSIQNIAYSAKFYYDFFVQTATFITNNVHYPTIFNIAGKEVFNIPKLVSYKNRKRYLNIYNRNKSIFKPITEIVKILGMKHKTAQEMRWENNVSIQQCNIDLKSAYRMKLAKLSMKAYFQHFLLITGMNDSVAATLPWSNEYTVEKTEHNFRNIKARANNKLVKFKLYKEFMPEFKLFLKLRDYLLDGNECKYLFFVKSGKEAGISKAQTNGTFSSGINKFMRKKFDPDLPIINSRQNRINISHFYIAHNNALVASKLLQNTLTAILKHYTGQSKETAEVEFSNFFNELHKQIIIDRSEGTSIEVGQCNDINNPLFPNMDSIDSPKQCTYLEGCLFCDNYRIHADKEDIMKLYSLEYLINECKYNTSSQNDFDRVYSPTLSRITEIIAKVQESNTQLDIEKIRSEVYDEQRLTPYFEQKLLLLITMGVLS